jgi:diguanylate cyclase (GGDEF)-like protein
VITGHDVTDIVMADAILAAENEILGMVASSTELNTTLDSICRMMDDRVGGVSSLWLLDEEADALIAVSGPKLAPEGRAEVGNSEAGIVSPWWVHQLPDGVFVSDPAVDENWADWRDEATRWGIGCSWTRPIRDDDGRMLGALIIYRSKLQPPSAQQEQLTELAARLAGVAVRRDGDARSLAHAATHDSVTGAANRTLFADRLRAAIARQRRGSAPPAVLFIDLDHFKQLNDRAGHSAGDTALRMLAQRLSAIVRPSDVVARYGGDEFAVLLEETSEDEAMVVAERLLAAISQPIDTGRRKHRLSASIGIAVGRTSIDADALVRRADLAMYRAKAIGRSRIERFQVGLLSHSGEQDLEQELRGAIERRELTVHYQPIADMPHSRWIGVEALARWDHPTLGSVTPAMFIPLAEEAGLIGALGEQILDLVIADAVEWADDPLLSKMHLGVNISGRQLADPKFVPMLTAKLEESGVPARSMFLELTETTMMEDFDAARASLRALQDLGVHIAIDDFGTGHSTLARLRQFPALALKLDRSFIEELVDDQRSEDVIAAVVQLAHAVGMLVCAEGVEDRAQLAVLHRLGVDLGQGYLLARPCPRDQIRDVLLQPPSTQPIAAVS